MFELLEQHTGLCKNDVETILFTISHTNNTNNIEFVADTFFETHLPSMPIDTGVAQMIRKELEIFLQGCDDIDTQRSVRRRQEELVSRPDELLSSPPPGAGASSNVVAGADVGMTEREGDNVEGGGSAVPGQHRKSSKKRKKPRTRAVLAPIQPAMHEEDEEMELAVEVVREIGGVVDEAEIVTKEDAYEKLKDMRVTLESGEGEVLQKQPPTSAAQVLNSLKMNRGLMTHCVIGETDTSNVKQSDATEQKCNTFCFVSKMDPKGSTPQEIQEVIYLLDMMNRFYTNQRPPPSSKAVDEIFDVPKVCVNGAKTVCVNGAVYHKMQVDDENTTVPLLKMKLFIEQANTGGESPLVMFFMFLVVEVPITFDLADAVYRSCTKQSFAVKDKLICEDMKRLWVNVAYRHQTFSGVGRETLESMLKVEFNDLFDPDSSNCFCQLFRIPRCIQQARLHMHMWAVDNITNRSKIPVNIANVLVHIRFSKIDSVLDGQCPSLLCDTIFSNMSNLCASSYADCYERYKRDVAEYRAANKKKKAGPANADEEENGGDGEAVPLEMPVFEPPIVVGTATFVDWSCGETKQMFLKLVVEGTVECPADCLRILDEHLANHPGSVRMQGFPITDMVAYVDSSMLLPHSSCYVGIAEWLMENRECALPDQMTMCILVMMHQRNISSRAIFSSFIETDDKLPRNILTLSDLRTSFLSDVGAGQTMMYRRATGIRDKQMQSIKSRPLGTQRGYALMYYLVGTAYPLAFANARSDSGAYGGRDAAASVFNEIGEYQNPGSAFLSCIAEGFHGARTAITKCDKDGLKWHLNKYQGSLYSMLHLWRASIEHMNENFRLKANNIQFFFRIMQSDVGMRLCFLVNAIGPAPNGIGFTNWVKNFGGNVMRRARRTNAQFEVCNKKSWGVGTDCTMAKFIEAISPENNKCPLSIPHAKCGKPEDWRKTTEAGTWYMFTQTYDQNNKVMSKPMELPSPMYCHELPTQDKANAGNSVNIPGKLCALLPRNTEVAQAGKRTLTVKNEKTGNHEGVVQVVCYHMQMESISQNMESDNSLEQTLGVICTDVAAGSVDVEEAEGAQSFNAEHRHAGSHDMGDSCRYSVKNNDATVSECKRLFAHDVRAVCISVTGQQWRGWMPDSPAGVETMIYDVLANYAYMHKDIQTQDARLTAQRGRETQKTQSRLPATSLFMHCANTLAQRNVHTLTWAEITSNATLNWMADPSPLELVPLFLGTIIENTFDWGFWLVLAIFADFFDAPCMPIAEAEAMFADTGHSVRETHSAPVRKWLQRFGIGNNSATAGAALTTTGDLFFKGDEEESTVSSAVYITTKWDSDMNVTSSKLSSTIQTNQVSAGGGGSGGGGGGGGGGAAGGKNDMTTSVSWKVSENVAMAMYKKYATALNSACNIYNPEELGIMIYRYMDAGVPYPKFGKVPCGQGFQSWNSVLSSVNCAVTNMCDTDHEDSSRFVDGLDPAMASMICRDKYSYNVPAWSFSNRGGSVFSFGVEPRFLILVRAMIGTKPLISQTSVQGIFDHFVSQTVKYRLPSTLFPYCTLFTGLPDSQGLGLSLHRTPEDEMYACKPWTLLRSLPCESVKHMLPQAIQGVVRGEMAEDIAHLNKFQRVCNMLDIHLDALHLEDLTPPQLPFYSWICVEAVCKTADLDQSTFDATTSPYHRTALYIDSASNRVFCYTSDAQFQIQDDILDITERQAEESPHLFCSPAQCKEFQSVRDALAATTTRFSRHVPIYNRPGVLLYVKNVGYVVLTQWSLPEIHATSAIKTPSWMAGQWFNPRTMTYLAHTEGLDLDEDTTYMQRLQDNDVDGASDIGMRCVEHLSLYRGTPLASTGADSLDTHMPDVDAAQADATLRQKLSYYFTLAGELRLSLSPRAVQNSIVGVGTILYLDVLHAGMPPDVVHKLRFAKTVGPVELLPPKRMKKMRTLDVQGFQKQCTNHRNFYPVLECMLLYEMPESIVAHNDVCDDDFLVWVGVRQLISASSGKKYFSRYLTVSTKMLVAAAKLEDAGVSLALFDSCL